MPSLATRIAWLENNGALEAIAEIPNAELDGVLRFTAPDVAVPNPVGATASTDILDRAAGDARYAPIATVGLTDGDKGDIVVSVSGTVLMFDSGVVTAFAKTFLDDADATAVRSTLGLVIGTNVQAYDADLTTWAGITPGTGVATALAANIGSAGAVVTFNGAGGTPSSLTLTNATGLPLSGLVASTSIAIGVGSIELGHASDTTITRTGAGDVAVEGKAIYRADGTDVSVPDGGTGRSTSTTAYALLAAGTTATGAHQTLAAGATTEILVGGGASALPVWTTATGTGAPMRAGSPATTGTLTAAIANFSGAVTTGALVSTGGSGMTSGYSRTFVAEANFPVIGLRSNWPASATEYCGLSYDNTVDTMSVWVGATTDDITAGTRVMDFAPASVAAVVPLGLPSYTVATLPASSDARLAFASNGRKTGEGAAAGTGLMVYRDGGGWYRPADDTAVAA